MFLFLIYVLYISYLFISILIHVHFFNLIRALIKFQLIKWFKLKCKNLEDKIIIFFELYLIKKWSDFVD